MITKDVRVVATFEELGNTLLESGKYSVAEINVQKPFQKDEIEKQVILAGNKEIPTLIEELILKLNK